MQQEKRAYGIASDLADATVMYLGVDFLGSAVQRSGRRRQSPAKAATAADDFEDNVGV